MDKFEYKTRELPIWCKVSFDWDIYEFLWMDWMYWRFRDIETNEIAICNAEFIKDENAYSELFLCVS